MIFDAISYNVSSLYELSLTLGEALTCTWTGRIILGMAFASVLAKLTRP